MVTPHAAAKRALCLGIVIQRGIVETSVSPTANVIDAEMVSAAAAIRKGQSVWLRKQGLWSSLSRSERHLLRPKLGRSSQERIAAVHWRAEGLAVMLWALRKRTELPAWDERVEPIHIVKGMPLGADTFVFISNATLRAESEIVEACGIAEDWYMRAKMRFILANRHDLTPTDKERVRSAISNAAEANELAGHFTRIDGDFPAFGVAYSAVSDDQGGILACIVEERLRALYWLCGQHSDWDKVRTDT
jgi:hypothetical protein